MYFREIRELTSNTFARTLAIHLRASRAYEQCFRVLRVLRVLRAYISNTIARFARILAILSLAS